jgi:hypothetical protein
MALPVKVHILELERLTNGHILNYELFLESMDFIQINQLEFLVKLSANNCIFIIPVCIKFM